MKLFVVRGFSVGFFRFRRSIKIAPGIKINLNKKSTSLTIGRRGIHTTINGSGVRNTIGFPGSGLSYTSYQKFDNNSVNTGVPYTRVCPNCGHNLLSLYTEQKTNQPAEPSWDDIKKDYSNLKNEINTNKTETGCGCLMMIFIVLIIYWLLS